MKHELGSWVRLRGVPDAPAWKVIAYRVQDGGATIFGAPCLEACHCGNEAPDKGPCHHGRIASFFEAADAPEGSA